METKIVQQALNEFGAMVVQRAQANLKKGGDYGSYNASGNLSKSLTFKTKVNPNSLEFDFFAEDYWKYVDFGVRGKATGEKAPFSPYKFGSGTGKKGGLRNAIDKWVVRKGLAGTRGKDGRFVTRKQMVSKISSSIYMTGTNETKFFRSAFDLEYQNFDEVIAEKYGLDLESFLKYVVNENIKR